MVGASVADRFSTSVPVVILLVDFSLYPPKRGSKRADFRSQKQTIVMFEAMFEGTVEGGWVPASHIIGHCTFPSALSVFQ